MVPLSMHRWTQSARCCSYSSNVGSNTFLAHNTSNKTTPNEYTSHSFGSPPSLRYSGSKQPLLPFTTEFTFSKAFDVLEYESNVIHELHQYISRASASMGVDHNHNHGDDHGVIRVS
ncbi:hypothetical protein QQP08_004292 [Theobroma cacao]|nr:hypothetical protein QQP08_004292 [Theobroma cacao]